MDLPIWVVVLPIFGAFLLMVATLINCVRLTHKKRRQMTDH